MDWTAIREQLKHHTKQYGIIIFLFLLGVMLMTVPGKEDAPAAETAQTVLESSDSLQDQLGNLLSQLEGAGKVRILLTVKYGQTQIYQSDDSQNSETAYQSKTVILTGSDRAQHALIQQVNPPCYLGAVVLCQGGDKASVRLAIVEAVSKATGLRADQISVLKMK